MPTATDLVTDLPADFEVFGQAVDTRLKALQPGTTLGDLTYSSATANTNTRLGIGSTGQVLTVTGGVPVWSTPGGAGSYTTIVATTAIGSVTSVTISSIPDTFKKLVLVLSNLSTVSNSTIYIGPNPTPSGQQSWAGVQGNGGYLATQNEGAWNATSRIYAAGDDVTSVIAEFPNYNIASAKVVSIFAASEALDGKIARLSAGAWFNTATINALSISNDSAVNFNSGTYALYGVN
jgi:hypothetical protein